MQIFAVFIFAECGMFYQVERLYLADGMKLAPSFVVHEAVLFITTPLPVDATLSECLLQVRWYFAK